MLSTLPISHDRTPIFWERPYVSKKPTPNQMVARESFYRKMRKLREGKELLQQPLHEVRGQAESQNEALAEYGQRPITGKAENSASSEFVTNSSNSLKYSSSDLKPSGGPITPVLRDWLLGKSPLRLIRERVEHSVPNSSSKYFVEALECGHTLTVHQPFFWDEGGHLFNSIPTAKRRRCQECRAIELALPPKKPVQSVREIPEKKVGEL